MLGRLLTDCGVWVESVQHGAEINTRILHVEAKWLVWEEPAKECFQCPLPVMSSLEPEAAEGVRGEVGVSRAASGGRVPELL